MSTILVMGATGNAGSHVAANLTKRNHIVRGATRNPQHAPASLRDTIQWISFDMTKPETFAAALENVDSVFMISRPGDEQADAVAQPLLNAMQDHNIQHIVYLSAMGAEQRPEFSTRKVERLIEQSDIPWTYLRPNFFMQLYSTGSVGQSLRKTGRIMLPTADAKLSLVDVRDVAAVASAILSDSAKHAHKAYTLTGPEAIDHHEIALRIAHASGKDIQYQPIDDDTMHALLKTAGFPEEWIARLLGMYRLVRRGACGPTSSDIETILNRPPVDFEQFCLDHASCWKD